MTLPHKVLEKYICGLILIIFMNKQGQWDSKLTFLLAMVGVAVGLGNIWRFSYVVYTNGGGSFFIPYLISIFILGIPFLILEYGIGFSFKKSFTEIVKFINPKFEWIAWIIVILIFTVSIYYMVILGWNLVYLFSSFTFSWGTDTSAYFINNVGGSSDLSNMGLFLIPTSIGVLISWVMLWFISNKKVDKGIGVASKILVPLLFLLMAIIIIFALTLPGANIGIHTLLNPNWNKLFDVNIWLAACSQIIFSLAVGETIILTYASYLPESSKLTDNVFMVVATNSIFEVCTGFGVFSILGFMSYTTGTPMVELISEGAGLIFIVFPLIFNIMGIMGRILAPLLFVTILFAGITSALSLVEPLLSSLSMKLDWSRKKTTTLLCVIGCLFSLILTNGINSYLIGVLDSFINQFGILFFIPVQAVIFSWIFDIDSIIPIINAYSSFKVGKIWKILVRYVCTIAVFGIWIYGIFGLFSSASSFEITIYVIFTVIVLIVSYILTKKNSLIK